MINLEYLKMKKLEKKNLIYKYEQKQKIMFNLPRLSEITNSMCMFVVIIIS